MSREVCGICWCPYDEDTGECACAPQGPTPPPEAQTEAEKIAYCAGWWDALAKARKAEPVQQGCEHCNQPLYAAIKCRVCGRVTEPSHQPVAWIHTDPDNPCVKFLEWRKDEPGYRGSWVKTPLYTSPQR